MPIRLTVGISKKLGLPRYSSVGASCELELELSSTLMDQGTAVFHEHVRRVYSACREAVEDELTRQQTAAAGDPEDGTYPEEARGNGRLQDENARRSDDHAGNGTAGDRKGNGRVLPLATAQQLEYAYDLAVQIDGMKEGDLDLLSQQVCARPLAELSRADASMLIGTLLELVDGQISLEILLGRIGPDAHGS
jgi:hypothetical protein